MNKITKVIASCLAILLMFALLACAAPVDTNTEDPSQAPANSDAIESDVQKVKDAGELVMLTHAGFPPFEYLGDDGELSGVDIDIANEIAKELGVELKVVDVDFDTIITSLVAGKGDIGVAGMTVTEERLKSIDFSINYVTSAQHLVVPEDNDTIKTSADLEGKTVGVQEGTTGDLYASGEWDGDFGVKSIERFKTAIDAGVALMNGKVEVIITDEMPAKSIVKQNEGLKMIEEPLTEEAYAIAMRKGSDLAEVINAKLQEMLDDGTIDGFLIKHTS